MPTTASWIVFLWIFATDKFDLPQNPRLDESEVSWSSTQRRGTNTCQLSRLKLSASTISVKQQLHYGLVKRGGLDLKGRGMLWGRKPYIVTGPPSGGPADRRVSHETSCSNPLRTCTSLWPLARSKLYPTLMRIHPRTIVANDSVGMRNQGTLYCHAKQSFHARHWWTRRTPSRDVGAGGQRVSDLT